MFPYTFHLLRVTETQGTWGLRCPFDEPSANMDKTTSSRTKRVFIWRVYAFRLFCCGFLEIGVTVTIKSLRTFCKQQCFKKGIKVLITM